MKVPNDVMHLRKSQMHLRPHLSNKNCSKRWFEEAQEPHGLEDPNEVDSKALNASKNDAGNLDKTIASLTIVADQGKLDATSLKEGV